MGVPMAFGDSKAYWKTQVVSGVSIQTYRPPVTDAQALVTRKAHGVIQDRGFGGSEARPKSRRYRRTTEPHPPEPVDPA